MDITISLGTTADIDELEMLYDVLNEYLASHINYPGWEKGSYPVREQAEEGVTNTSLYVARCGDKIAGTIILNKSLDYKGKVCWGINSRDDEVLCLHTFVVHPDYFQNGIGRLLLEFAYDKARQENMKALRLDVYENNLPAIRLYEKLGYKYIDTVDLGLGCYGLDWFRLYEKVIP